MVNGYLQPHHPYHKYVYSLCTVQFYFVSRFSLYRDIVRFAFGRLIQQQLAEFASEWNRHNIRLNRIGNTSSGCPNVMYYYPHLHGI